jgi:hypothetical protein
MMHFIYKWLKKCRFRRGDWRVSRALWEARHPAGEPDSSSSSSSDLAGVRRSGLLQGLVESRPSDGDTSDGNGSGGSSDGNGGAAGTLVEFHAQRIQVKKDLF